MFIERGTPTMAPFAGAELLECQEAQLSSAASNGASREVIVFYKHLTPDGVNATRDYIP